MGLMPCFSVAFCIAIEVATALSIENAALWLFFLNLVTCPSIVPIYPVGD